MRKYKFRKASEEDASISYRLRDADKKELNASNLTDHYEAMKKSITLSEHCFVVIINNEVHAICGVLPNGIIWAMTTDDMVSKYVREFHSASKRFNEFCLKKYKGIGNYVWEGNTVHIKWLKRMGYIFMDGNEMIVEETGERFIPFYMRYGE